MVIFLIKTSQKVFSDAPSMALLFSLSERYRRTFVIKKTGL
jgi:hypothetical protein